MGLYQSAALAQNGEGTEYQNEPLAECLHIGMDL
jgi:hypothetical protein